MPMASAATIWTVGHSTHDLDRFLTLLDSERIEFLVDVRSYPYSRFAPQFNREDLAESLNAHAVRYLFLGDELGGRPSKPEHYDSEGHALYGEMAHEPSFEAAITRLREGAEGHRIALMCSEGKPEECHRRLLVGKVLTERGITLRHVLPDGSVFEEEEVKLPLEASQEALFGDQGQTAWRSTQSVSRRRRLSTSSAA
jgi:uncharacterized protein (DUF488 family)